MLLPYRVKISDTKVTHFTPILALYIRLYRSHLQKPVSMKQTKLWHSLAKLRTKNYENPSIFVKVTAKKISGTFFSGHGVVVYKMTKKWVIASVQLSGRHTSTGAKFHVHRGRNVGIQPQNCQNFEFWP